MRSQMAAASSGEYEDGLPGRRFGMRGTSDGLVFLVDIAPLTPRNLIWAQDNAEGGVFNGVGGDPAHSHVPYSTKCSLVYILFRREKTIKQILMGQSFAARSSRCSTTARWMACSLGC
jgi:hypothetical protein